MPRSFWIRTGYLAILAVCLLFARPQPKPYFPRTSAPQVDSVDHYKFAKIIAADPVSVEYQSSLQDTKYELQWMRILAQLIDQEEKTESFEETSPMDRTVSHAIYSYGEYAPSIQWGKWHFQSENHGHGHSDELFRSGNFPIGSPKCKVVCDRQQLSSNELIGNVIVETSCVDWDKNPCGSGNRDDLKKDWVIHRFLTCGHSVTFNFVSILWPNSSVDNQDCQTIAFYRSCDGAWNLQLVTAIDWDRECLTIEQMYEEFLMVEEMKPSRIENSSFVTSSVR